MALDQYMTVDDLNNYIDGTVDNQSTIKGMLKNMDGIDGIPYQFMESVDRRVADTDIGAKYAEKIVSRMPLLFLTPAKPVFMDDSNFTDADKANVAQALIDKIENFGDLLNTNSSGRYYTLQFEYDKYWNYVNTMTSAVAAFMGISNTQVTIGGKYQKLGNIAWQNTQSDSFKTFFSAKENVVFYLDEMTSVTETFSNSTTESSLASQLNGFSDQAKEISFLLGNGALAELAKGGADVTSTLTGAVSGIFGAGNKLGGGIVGSLLNKDSGAIDTIITGGKIAFPEIWQDSQFDRSYSVNIKLRSPDNDNVSIFLNILVPYCKLLCLTLPRELKNIKGDTVQNANAYSAPFLVKAFCKGFFSTEYGIIGSMSATKGAQCAWNDDGLPTQIDVSLDIKDLYSQLNMSAMNLTKKSDIVNNTAYLDFLANMSGLNIAQMEIGRRTEMYIQLTKTQIMTTPANLWTKFDIGVSKLASKLYDRL